MSKRMPYLTEFLKRRFGLFFGQSKNKTFYRQLAAEYSVSPKLVYKLVHGRTPRTETEARIRKDLKRERMLWTH